MKKTLYRISFAAGRRRAGAGALCVRRAGRRRRKPRRCSSVRISSRLAKSTSVSSAAPNCACSIPRGMKSRLPMVKGTDAYIVPLSGTGTRVIHGVVDLGFSQSRGPKPYLLMYYPKSILGNAFDGKSALPDQTPVQIVPLGKPGALKLQLLVRGKPQPDSEITVILPDNTQKKAQDRRQGSRPSYSPKPDVTVRGAVFGNRQRASVTARNTKRFATTPPWSSMLPQVRRPRQAVSPRAGLPPFPKRHPVLDPWRAMAGSMYTAATSRRRIPIRLRPYPDSSTACVSAAPRNGNNFREGPPCRA